MTPTEREALLIAWEFIVRDDPGARYSISHDDLNSFIQTIRDQQAALEEARSTKLCQLREIDSLQAEIERLRGEKKELLVKLYANSFTSDHD